MFYTAETISLAYSSRGQTERISVNYNVVKKKIELACFTQYNGSVSVFYSTNMEN